MQIDMAKPLDKLTRLTPDFFQILARKDRDRTWHITPSWVSNGFFLVLRARLPFELSKNLEIAGVELAELFGPRAGSYDVRTHPDVFFKTEVLDKYSDPEFLLYKSQLLSFKDSEKKLWLFRGGNAWALLNPYLVTRFQLKVVYGQKPLFNGPGTLLRYHNLCVCPFGPMKMNSSEAANLTADEYLRALSGEEESDELPLFNPPRRIIWKGSAHAK